MTGNSEHYVFNITEAQRNEIERALRYFGAEVLWKKNLLDHSSVHDPQISEVLNNINEAIDAVSVDSAKGFWLPMGQKKMIPVEYRRTAQVKWLHSTCCDKFVYRRQAGDPWRCLGCRTIQTFGNATGADAS